MNTTVLKSTLLKLKSRDLSLGTRILLLVAGTTVVLVGALLATSVLLYTKDKVTYIYDLQDLKTERLGDALRRVLERESSVASRANDKASALDIKTNPMERGLPRLPEFGEIFVGEEKIGSGKPLVVFRDANGPRAADAKSFDDAFSKIEGVQALSNGERVYWLSSFGNLLASTHKMESDRNDLAKRPAVSMFLRNSLTKGLVTVVDEENNLVAGFKEVPGTNTAVFIETPLRDAMRPLRRFVGVAVFVALSVIIFGLTVSAQIFEKMWRPVRGIEWLTRQIAEGDYDARVPYSRKDEIGELFGFLSDMANGLKAREQTIHTTEKQLRIVEVDRTRLEASMEAAQVIQAQLIDDTKSMGAIPSLEIAAVCLSADTCSGDWFGFYHDTVGEVVMGVVTDVTGHGLASALITGVTAGVASATTTMFELLQTKHLTTLSPEERLVFLHSTLDTAILRCGKTKIYASAFLFCFDIVSRRLHYINAGHPAALLFSKDAPKPQFMPSQTDLLGFESLLDPRHVNSVSLGVDDTILIYTDGLVEYQNENVEPIKLKTFTGKFSKKLISTNQSAAASIKWILNETQFSKDSALQDDVTLVVLKGIAPDGKLQASLPES